jgi:hypothetical protein
MLRRKAIAALLCALPPLGALAQTKGPASGPIQGPLLAPAIPQAPVQGGAPTPPTPPAPPTSPQAFLENIYRPYLKKDFKGQPYWEAADYFEPDLARAMDQDREEAKRASKPPALNADPFVNGTDRLITDLEVAAFSSGNGGNGAIGNVIFSNQGGPQHVTIDLVKTPLGWRIAEIRGTGLRARYKLR